MNRFVFHESILFKKTSPQNAKMNQFTILESQNRLSTIYDIVMQIDLLEIRDDIYITSAARSKGGRVGEDTWL